MKKTISLLVALALGCSAAFAQEPGIFNHLSIGVGLVGTDGNGIQVAAPIGNVVQVRAGFTTHALNILAADVAAKGIDEVGSINPFKKTVDVNVKESGVQIDKVDLEARVKSHNMQLLFDFFPIKKSSFHITAGAYFSLAPSGLVNASAKPIGSNVFPDPSHPNKTQIYGVTADPQGVFHLDVQYGCKVVRPYVGIGFGRPVNLNNRVGVNFDMGLAYLGGAKLVTYNYFDNPESPEAVVIDAAWIDKVAADNPSIKDKAATIKDYLDMANTFTQVLPVLKLTLFIRLF